MQSPHWHCCFPIPSTGINIEPLCWHDRREIKHILSSRQHFHLCEAVTFIESSMESMVLPGVQHCAVVRANLSCGLSFSVRHFFLFQNINTTHCDSSTVLLKLEIPPLFPHKYRTFIIKKEGHYAPSIASPIPSYLPPFPPSPFIPSRLARFLFLPHKPQNTP